MACCNQINRNATQAKACEDTSNATNKQLEDYRFKRARVDNSAFMKRHVADARASYSSDCWEEYEQGYEKKGVPIADDWSNIEQKPIDHPDVSELFDSLTQKHLEVYGEDREMMIRWLVKNAKTGIKSCSNLSRGRTCYDKQGQEYQIATRFSFMKPERKDFGANDMLIRVTNITPAANEFEPKVYQFTRGQMEWALRGLYNVFQNTCKRIQDAKFIKSRKLSKDTRYSVAQSVAFSALCSLYNLYNGITWKKYCAIRDLTASSYFTKRCLKNETGIEFVALRDIYPDIDAEAEKVFEEQMAEGEDVPDAKCFQDEKKKELQVMEAVEIKAQFVEEKLETFVVESVPIEVAKVETVNPKPQRSDVPVPVICSIIVNQSIPVVNPRHVSLVQDKIVESNVEIEEVNTTDCETCDEKEFMPMQIVNKSETLYDCELHWPLRAGEMDILYEYVDLCVFVDDVVKCLKRRVFTASLNQFIRKSLCAFSSCELTQVRLSPYRILCLCRENVEMFLSMCRPLFKPLKEVLPQESQPMEEESQEFLSGPSHNVNSFTESCVSSIQKHLQESQAHHFTCMCASCVKVFLRRSFVSSWYKQLRDNISPIDEEQYQEMLRPQMAKEDKGEDPECHENVTKDANITFVDEREIVSDTQNFTSNISAKDPNKDVADTEWSLKDVLTREVLLMRTVWPTSKKFGEELYRNVPLSLDQKDIYKLHNNIMRNFAYYRCGVSYRVQINGTKFHCGRLICVYRPVSFVDQIVSPYNYTLYPHCFLDASISNSAELFVPFSSIFSYFSTRRDFVLDSYPMSLGSFRICVWSPLQAATGASTELGMNVYVKLVNPELHQSMTRADDVPPIPADMPVTQMAKEDDEQPVVLRTTQPLCHGDLAKYHAIRLGLTKSDSSQHEAAIKGSTDNFDISKFISQYTLLDVAQWPVSSSEALGSYPVTPSFINRTKNEAGCTIYTPSMLAYLSRMFVYWRGSLTYKVQVISTQFHSGRLMVSFVPYSHAIPKDIMETSATNTIIFDIEEKKELEFTIPYMSTRPWMRSDHFVSRAVDVPYPGTYYDGMFKLVPISPLVCPDNVAKTIEVLLYVRGGQDLEFALPAPLDDLYLHNYNPDSKFLSVLLPYSIRINKQSTKQLIIGKSREFILDLFIKGKKLLQDGLIVKGDPWVKSQASTLGTFYTEVLNWITRAQLTRYYDDDGVEWQFIKALDDQFKPDGGSSSMDKILAQLSAINTGVASINSRVTKIANAQQDSLTVLKNTYTTCNTVASKCADIYNSNTRINSDTSQIKGIVGEIKENVGPKDNPQPNTLMGLTLTTNAELVKILEKIPQNASEELENISNKLTGLTASFEVHAAGVAGRFVQFSPHITKMKAVKQDTGAIDRNTANIKDFSDNIQQKCDQIIDKVADVIERQNYQNGKLNTLDDNVTKIEANTASVKSIVAPVDDIKNYVQKINDTTDSLRNIVSTIDSNVQNVAGDLSDIKSTLDSVSSAVDSISDDSNNISGNTNSLPSKLINIDQTITKINAVENSIDEEVKQITDNVKNLKTEISEFNTAVKPSIDSLKSDVNNILANIRIVPTISDNVENIAKDTKEIKTDTKDIFDKILHIESIVDANLDELVGIKDDTAHLQSIDDNIKTSTKDVDIIKAYADACHDELVAIKDDVADPLIPLVEEIKIDTGKILDRMPDKSNLLKPQSKAEEHISGNNANDPKHIVITKGFRHQNVNNHTVGENAMQIKSVLNRFYNIYNSPTIRNSYDYVLFTIPVRPVNSIYTSKGPADEIYKEYPYSTHLAWFSSLYTFWHGSLRYRAIYDVNSEVVVLHHPTCVKDFTIEYGISPLTIQQLESYAAAMAVSKTQNAIEVEVPFMSPYNQLLTAFDKKTPKLYTQNGALLIAIRSKSGVTDDLHFSLFQAAGSNFSLSVHRPVPQVFQPIRGALELMVVAGKVTDKPDCNLRKDEKTSNVETPLTTNLDNVVKEGTMTPASYLWEEYKEMAQWKPNSVDEMLKPQMGILDSIPGYQALKNVSKTLDNVHQVSEDMRELTKSATDLINPKQDGFTIINNYSSIAVNVLMMYTLVDCFKEIFKAPTISNFVKFGSVFSSLIGYNFSHSLKLLLNQLTAWCTSECTVPQPQSLNEDMADVIESVEEKIVPILAVIGTIVYAYVFNVIPKLADLKAWIRQFFESDKIEETLKTQGKTFEPSNWLKNAHFSFLGLNAIGRVYEKFCEYVQMFIDWILDRENPEIAAQRKAGEYKEELLSLIKEIDELDYDPTIEEAFQDPLVHDRFYALMDKANKMHDVFVKNPSADKYILSIVRETRTRALKLLQKLEKEKPTSIVRYAPFTICLSGDTGTGKTQCLPDIIHTALDAINAPKHNRIFNRSITKDGFWNGYKNQSAVAWDEFGQSTEADDVVPEILTLCGNEPYQVNMAALEDKGRYFTSKLIVMTTNVPYERFANTLRHPDAFLRRRNYMIGVQLRTGDVESTVKKIGFDPEYSHCIYARLDPMTNQVIKPNMTFAELKEDIKMEMQLWDQKQRNILQHYEKTLPDAVLPRGLIVVDKPIVTKKKPWESGKKPWETDDEDDEEAPILPTQAEQKIVECKEELVVHQALGDGNCFYHSLILLGFKGYETPQQIRKELLKCPFLSKELKEQIDCMDETVPIDNWATQDTCEAIADWFHCTICLHINGQPNCWRFGVEEPIYHLNFSGNDQAGHFSPMKPSEKRRIVKDKTIKLTDFEKFERDCFLERLESMDEKDCAILVEKAARAMTVKERGKWFYLKCKKYLNSLSDKIVSWFKNNSKLATILGCIILLSSAGALLLKDNKEEEASYSCDPKHLPRRIVRAEGYECGPKCLSRRIVRAEMMELQGCEDMNAYTLKNKIHQAIVPVSWNSDTGNKGSLLSVHIGGSVILLPWHFFRDAKDGQHFWLKHRFNFVDVEFQHKNMVRIKDNDWVLYNCEARLEPRKLLIKYFISESDLSRIKKIPTLLLGIDDDGERVMQYCSEARYNAKSVYGEAEKNEYYEQRGWETITTTKSGDCGSLHLGLSTALPCPRKIIGMHVAGLETKSRGFAVLVVQEQLQEAWNLINQKEPQVIGMPIPEEVKVPQSLTEIRIIPEGDYSLHGKMPAEKSPAQPQKTSFIPTPFVNIVKKIYPMTKKPCHLRQFRTSEGVYTSPLKNALSKYGKQTLKIPDKNLDKIEKFIGHWLEEMECIEDRRVFDTKEAVMGIPGQPEFEPLNMRSSPGWPYQCGQGQRKSGKYHLFDEDFNIIDEELKARLVGREEEAKQNRRVASIWRDCLKDQLMTVEKVEKGKARLFTIPPVDYTILARKYFIAFSANFYHNHNKFFHAVGINAESYEWTQLYHYLLECGDQVIAGDFGTFDGTLMPELIQRTVRIINNWYNDSQESQNVRRVLGNEMIHTMQLVENCVYSSHQGNPSGNPLTVIVNSICNLFYMLNAWLEIYPDRTLDDFRQNCRIVVYGDDNLISVKHNSKEFNQNSITKILAKYGIEYQSDAKDGKEVPDFRKLDDVTFLKRGFKIDKNISKNIVLPIMSKETLYSYLFWFRKNQDEEEQLCANARSALNFAFFHGKEFYEEYFGVWQKCMKSCGYNVPCISYEEWRDVFLFSCGMPKLEMEKFMDLTNNKISRTISGLVQAPVYYLCAAMGLGQVEEEVERTDDRWAVAIPSGEGKSYLCSQYPNVFVDHDELLLPAFKVKHVFRAKLPWRAEEAQKLDFPESDRRILLVHHANNTKRKLIGSFITHYPTFIRLNILQRLMMKHPVKLSREERNNFLINFARENEPDLFVGHKIIDKQPLDRRK